MSNIIKDFINFMKLERPSDKFILNLMDDVSNIEGKDIVLESSYIFNKPEWFIYLDGEKHDVSRNVFYKFKLFLDKNNINYIN